MYHVTIANVSCDKKQMYHVTEQKYIM